MADRDAVRREYEERGVVRLREFLTPEQVAEVRGEIDRYIAHDLSRQAYPDCTFETDGKTVRNLWRLEQHANYFKTFGEQPQIRRLASTLVHGEPVLMAVETFNKAARVGSGVPYHQDNAYFCQAPPDVLTMWIAIDAVTVENGAVYYVEGSHRLGMLPARASGVAGNSVGLADPPTTPKAEQFCCTLNAGDAAIHHCQTIHHSDPNLTGQSRLGLLLVFRGAHTVPDVELRTAYAAAASSLKTAAVGS